MWREFRFCLNPVTRLLVRTSALGLCFEGDLFFKSSKSGLVQAISERTGWGGEGARQRHKGRNKVRLGAWYRCRKGNSESRAEQHRDKTAILGALSEGR